MTTTSKMLIFVMSLLASMQLIASRSPIILVPGAGGSKAYSFVGCDNNSKSSIVWVHYGYMMFPSALTNTMKLHYNPITRRTRNLDCSKVFFPGWGTTDTIEVLSESKLMNTVYYSTLVKNLIEDRFYVRNKTVRGAPFDFRKAPNENSNFVHDMKALVEETYRLSNNQRVAILGHSMGSLYTLFFLKKMSHSWKKHYIRSFISVGAPLGGAVKTAMMLTSGYNLGSPRSGSNFREAQRTFPSSFFMLPRPELFGNEPIAITPKRTYSAYDFKDMFVDMGLKYGNMMYDDTFDLVNATETPDGVDELYCINGYGLKTEKQMIFKSFPDQDPSFIYGDGDSTVNSNSLDVCKRWKNVKHYGIKNGDHLKMLAMPEFLNRVKQILYHQPNTQFNVKTFQDPSESFLEPH